MKEKLRRFMWGRYGYDKLGVALVIASMVFSFFGAVLEKLILYIPSYILLGWALFRMLSRSLSARRAENTKFLKLASPVEKWFKLQANKLRDRKTHRYLACPSCKNTLRLPKGRGEITVTCPVCKSRFDART